MVLTACSSESEELSVKSEVSAGADTEVTLTFSPYEVSAMTRAATSIADFCTHLDVWVTDGTTTADTHQTTTDADFGEVSLTLDKTKMYTVYAVAHKCTADATLADGIISFPEDKVTHTLYYTTTFTPTKDMVLSCLMTRIVAQFQLATNDAVPADVKKLRFTLGNVFNRWSVTTGGTNQLNREVVVNITSTHDDGTITCSVYGIVTDAQTTHTVTVDALSEADAVLQTRVFENVPLRNGYRTTYRGSFFIDAPMTMTFTCDDCNEFDVINF